MGQPTNNNGKSIEDILKQSDFELTSGWAKLASLVMAYEGVEWKEAGAKARTLLRDEKDEAMAYVKKIRNIFRSPSKSKGKTTKSSKKKNKKEKVKQDRFSKNYRRLMKIAPELEEFLVSGKEVSGKSKVTGYMDFNLEKTFENKRGHYLAVSHYYKQNGDMVPDPDMVIRVDIKNQIVEALTFQNSYYYAEVYDDYMNPERMSPKEKRSQNAFLENWLVNLINQGHVVDLDDVEAEKEITAAEVAQMEIERDSLHEELSFMDDAVVSDIKEEAEKMMLDDVIQTVLKDGKDEKPKVRPVVQYFFIKRINESPLGLTIDYPPFGEIRQDYEKLVAQKAENDRIDKLAEDIAQAKTDKKENTEDEEVKQVENEESEVDETEVAETVKHWTKLTAVIQNVEGLNYEEAKEKALSLKKTGEAENYVIRAFNRKSASSLNQLYKLNYQQLLRLIPSLAKGEIKDQAGLLKRPKDDDPLRLKYEGMESSTKSIELLSIQKVKQDEIAIVGIQEKGGKVRLLSRNGNFDNRSDFDEGSANDDERLKANKEFGSWLKVMLYYGFEDISDTNPKSENFEHPVAKLLKKFPIVIEWSEGNAGEENIGIKSLEDLQVELKSYKYPKKKDQGYSKTKVWFRNYQYYVRIDLSKNGGDYYPPDMNLLEWLKKGDSEFDWEQFSKVEKKEKGKKEKKEKNEKKDKVDEIPDFEPGKVKLVEAHKRVGLDQKDIDWINKHKRGMTITPLSDMKNKTKSFEADMTQQAMKPGWRISKTGKLYRENRSNRSDLTNEGI